MNWALTKNNRSVALKNIPPFSVDVLHAQIVDEYRKGKRIIGFFGTKVPDGITLFAVLADDAGSRLLIAQCSLKNEQIFHSLTPEVPAVHLFEREIFEQFGIKPLGHPWLKPVRYPFDRYDPSQTPSNYPFFKLEGEEIHEVGVGPIHAGVIEPGHFRFMCLGEKIHHLEIQLGYQHRGMEALFLAKPLPGASRFQPHLAESIASDSAVGHAMAYAQAIESLTGTEISREAMAVRAIALELERVAVHIGDLGAISQ